MYRNGTHCKDCPTASPCTVEDGRYRLTYCPRCYTVLQAWERDGLCLTQVDVDALLMPVLTMLDLGEAIAPGKRSGMDMEAYRVDDGARLTGVPTQTPLKVA